MKKSVVRGCAVMMVLGMLWSGMSVAVAEPPGAASGASAQVYDERADGEAQLTAALAKARRQHQRVLVVFGGNWCGWCKRLHTLFEDPKQPVYRVLQYEYQVVRIDVGRFDKHMAIAKRFGLDLKKTGVPALTVVDAEGKVLVNQETGALEKGKAHDPAKVLAFLKQWQAPPVDAQEVLQAAQAQAAREGKHVLVRLGAPWCVWCHRLGDFLAEEAIAKVVSADVVDVMIDLDRMRNGKAVAQAVRGTTKGGLPWYALTKPDGAVVITSDSPEGNIGFPVKPAEIEYFGTMLQKVAKRATPAQIESVLRALRERRGQDAHAGAAGSHSEG